MGQYFGALSTLVERVATRSGRGKVVLIGHSAGPSVMTAYLAGRPPAWKAAYVHSAIMLNGNLGGEIDCLENLWQGGDFLNAAEGVTSWPTSVYRRQAQWTWPITSWCLPSVSYSEDDSPPEDIIAPITCYCACSLLCLPGRSICTAPDRLYP